jgi:nucleotide-binding universal stress UspA family protein
VYKKILVPLDGSEHSTRALLEAIKIAKMTKGQITLAHVYPSGSSLVISSKQHLYELMLQKGKVVLTEGKNVAKSQGVDVETLLLEGDAVEQIVITANHGGFDLLVIGARGLSNLTGLILGSVSQGIIKNAQWPVLVTR